MTESVSAARQGDSMLEISDSRLANLIAGLNIWTSAGRSQQPEIDMDLCCALMELQRVRAEALARTPSEGEVVAYLHRPTGNVFSAKDHAILVPRWIRQFAETFTPEAIAADFTPLYATPGKDTP